MPGSPEKVAKPVILSFLGSEKCALASLAAFVGVPWAAWRGSVAWAFGCVACAVAFGGHLDLHIHIYIYTYIYIYI